MMKENLSQAKKMIKAENFELILMRAEDLAFRENTFGVVLMIEVLEHVINDRKVISEIYRILKPSGKLVITTPNKLFPFETHGFRIGSRIYGTKGLGFPLLTYLPEILRKYVANVRVYMPSYFQKMLVEEDFSINNVGFLSPSLDQLKVNFPKLNWFIKHLQKLLDNIERSPLRYFLTTIIVCAEKLKK